MPATNGGQGTEWPDAAGAVEHRTVFPNELPESVQIPSYSVRLEVSEAHILGDNFLRWLATIRILDNNRRLGVQSALFRPHDDRERARALHRLHDAIAICVVEYARHQHGR